MSEPFGQKKKSGLAITSLVLGILSVTCCFIFAGIPAVICGHIARGKAKKDPLNYAGAGLALAGLILGYLSLPLTILGSVVMTPAIVAGASAARSGPYLIDAQQIHTAIEEMVSHAKTADDKSLGYPADAGITSVSELKARLIKSGALTEADATRLHFSAFKYGNVSASDPSNTIEIMFEPESDVSSKYSITVVVDKGGKPRLLLPAQKDEVQAPPREPAYLAP